MKIVWNEQSVQWFRRASDYTGYSRNLAKLLLEDLPQGGTLCDMGCGSALVDFELAPYFQQITCVDISERVIASVREEITRRGAENITAVHADGRALPGSWDAVIALFHGGEDLAECYLRKANDTLILATHGESYGNFGPAERKVFKRYGAAGMKDYLDLRGIHYTVRETAIEYGQPLTDRDDARAFVRAYTAPMEDAELEAYLAETLVETGREDFPYYLPNRRKIGLFTIRRCENEGFFEA